MNILCGSVLIALSLTILAFAQCNGYVPVSRPTYRVYRDERPAYFWNLIAAYALVGTIGIHILIN